jgi:hypothetical protein
VVTRIQITERLKWSSSENWLERNMFVCGGREGGREGGGRKEEGRRVRRRERERGGWWREKLNTTFIHTRRS